MTDEQLVSKVWNYAHVLRDQGISYGDYIEQITYLLFLKMDQEREDLLGEPSAIPPQWSWKQLANKDGDALELQYRHTLENLGVEDGLIGTIFRKAMNKLSDPAKLKRIVSLIDKEGPWVGLQVDVKGEIYEGLLERNASEVRSGAGQYFTPRPVIDAIVKCVDPKIGDTLLRLPTGIWYSPGVKANVLFFDKRPASRDVQTKELWVYDYRTNVHKTLKTKRLARGDFDDFIQCYRERKETERFRCFPYEELAKRDKLNLDIFWLKDDSLEDIDNLPSPDILSAEIVENLEAALEQFRSVAQELDRDPAT